MTQEDLIIFAIQLISSFSTTVINVKATAYHGQILLDLFAASLTIDVILNVSERRRPSC